jgi:hypothetical protein
MYNGSLGREQVLDGYIFALLCCVAVRLFDYIEGIKSMTKRTSMNLYYDALYLSLTFFVFLRYTYRSNCKGPNSGSS